MLDTPFTISNADFQTEVVRIEPEQAATLAKFTRWVRVHFMKRGIHYYGAAATDPKLKTGDKYDVSYLATPHAHDFWYQVDVEVFQNDRDIEFIQLRLWLEDQYESGTLECGHRSVEMLAEELINVIARKYPGRRIKVGVYEDSLHGCGGLIEYEPIGGL